MSEKITILYVDDEPLNLMLFRANLKKNYNVHTSLSGEDGLKQLSQHPEISVVFSDMRMPGMNGLEFIAIAKKDYPSIVYFILTGYDITEEISHALKNNLIACYFSKPFNIKEIEKKLASLL